ncbi:rCG63579 [Rattus norvegicus]|uniref:RCG63579 n=1 Tax=Rattus norvegicus TaxID=10116 RepID=A6ICQ3_RAT|nr:rCG63579 [Rattus norvegicus]
MFCSLFTKSMLLNDIMPCHTCLKISLICTYPCLQIKCDNFSLCFSFFTLTQIIVIFYQVSCLINRPIILGF